MSEADGSGSCAVRFPVVSEGVCFVDGADLHDAGTVGFVVVDAGVVDLSVICDGKSGDSGRRVIGTVVRRSLILRGRRRVVCYAVRDAHCGHEEGHEYDGQEGEELH